MSMKKNKYGNFGRITRKSRLIEKSIGSNSSKPLSSDENSTLTNKIADAVKGLTYMSESDAEITAFNGGRVESVTPETLFAEIVFDFGEAVEERNFAQIFNRLTKKHDWHGEEERRTADKFSLLRRILEENLSQIKVYAFGDVQKKIYIVGVDRKGYLQGVYTSAVET